MRDISLLSLICVVAMVSPGPDFLLISRNALRYPAAQAFATAAGVVASCCLHSLFCVLGLAIIVTRSVLLFSLLKYFGACYLMYLGVKSLLSKHARASMPDSSRSFPEISVRAAFAQGFLCNFLNPKLAIFLLSLFTQFISVKATMHDKAIVAGVFLTESAIYWPLVVLFFQMPKVRDVFLRIQRLMDYVFGALLIGMGIKVAVSRD